jgi:pyruvate dehydrogenase E2 component (dihydrolipoamide acetyltransferase)
MADFILPELGENVSAGDVVRILVKPGDSIAKDQPVLELETDKATIEVPSSVSGTVKDVKVKQGDKVKVGQSILTVAESDDNGKTASPKADAGAKAEAPAKAKPQPVDAAAEGGQAQRVVADEQPAGDSREQAREERESDKPGTADAPQSQRAAAPRLRKTRSTNRRGSSVAARS